MAQAPTMWFNDRLRFVPEAFGQYVDMMPRTKTFRFMNSGIVTQNGDLTKYFGPQPTTYSMRVPIYGSLEAEEYNYDGETPMGEAGKQDTYSRAVVSYGRKYAVEEKDFSFDLIPGADFNAVLRKAIVENRDRAFEKRLFAITNALFGATEGAEKEFADTHTYDIAAGSGAEAKIGETTLNNALQQACGEFKSDFSMIAMHSQVATNLENLKLLQYAKGVDENGVIKDLGIATWNGKTIVIDDAMPFDSELGVYTTYAFGKGMFEYANIPVMNPFEPVRDATNDIDKLFCRYREVLAPKGFSFEGATASLSPTETELATAGNWKLADNGKTGEDRKTYPIKRIPLVRITSLG